MSGLLERGTAAVRTAAARTAVRTAVVTAAVRGREEAHRRTPQDLAAQLGRTHPARRRALLARLRLVVGTLESGDPAAVPDGTAESLLQRFEACLAGAQDDRLWFALAALAADYPEGDDVVRARRAVVLDGVLAAFEHVLVPDLLHRFSKGSAGAHVDVLVGRVLVDVEHTARTELATGIQRVTREATRRWVRDHDLDLVGWSPGYRALRRLLPREQDRALTGQVAHEDDGRPASIVVPWRCTYVLPELAPERTRTIRLAAMARFSGSRTCVVGHDCIPISSSETADANVSEAFTGFLSAVRSTDVVACVSRASAAEFSGWRHMLSAIGAPGPRITAVGLPAEVGVPSVEAMDRTRDRLVTGTLPMVLVVGTHEPRKNHLAVLEAARAQWEAGQRFSLVFIGGHAWASDRFEEVLEELQEQGRPVETVTSVDDEGLWSAYRLAHVVLFPSLNEGFGLPVAEALASGTPVITSRYGSMREVAEAGGALLVDPRDDGSIADALGAVLGDPALVARLRAEAADRPVRTWDDYAREAWEVLVEDRA